MYNMCFVAKLGCDNTLLHFNDTNHLTTHYHNPTVDIAQYPNFLFIKVTIHWFCLTYYNTEGPPLQQRTHSKGQVRR